MPSFRSRGSEPGVGPARRLIQCSKNDEQPQCQRSDTPTVVPKEPSPEQGDCRETTTELPMPDFEQILRPVDGSDLSRLALQHAVVIAGWSGSTLIVLRPCDTVYPAVTVPARRVPARNGKLDALRAQCPGARTPDRSGTRPRQLRLRLQVRPAAEFDHRSLRCLWPS
jgi:hypothetical protein